MIDTIYSSRMLTQLKQADRDYLTYEYSRSGVAEMNPKYFLTKNWDLYSAIGKICKNDFPFSMLQLQADSDPAPLPEIFANAATECPNVTIEWVTNDSHFDNFDQPEQVANAISRFVHTQERKKYENHP